MTNRDITINYAPSREWWGDMLENLWVTILEGGSNYWVDKMRSTTCPTCMLFKDDLPSLKSGPHLLENFEVTVYHGADEWDSRVYSDTVKGQARSTLFTRASRSCLMTLRPSIMNNGDWDANDADHIFQLGVFGEVRYG